jgi:quercetin dioxygenase-like cupin family protein
MKLIAIMVVSLTLYGQSITISHGGTLPSNQGSAEPFTGSVRIDPLFSAAEPSRAAGARVTFEPGARTVWHSHPLGETLIVTEGPGWVQQCADRCRRVERGRGPNPPGPEALAWRQGHHRMTHIAIHEHLDGKVVEWMEKVSENSTAGDEQRATCGFWRPAGYSPGDGG